MLTEKTKVSLIDAIHDLAFDLVDVGIELPASSATCIKKGCWFLSEIAERSVLIIATRTPVDEEETISIYVSDQIDTPSVSPIWAFHSLKIGEPKTRHHWCRIDTPQGGKAVWHTAPDNAFTQALSILSTCEPTNWIVRNKSAEELDPESRQVRV